MASVIIGASRPEQIDDNLNVLQSAPLSHEELEQIDHICGVDSLAKP